MVKLTDVADIKYGCAFDSKSFTDDDSYPQLVRIRDVKRGFSETFYKGEYSRDYVLSTGDLLVGMDGEFNIARWKVDGALLNQRVCKIVARPGTYEEYLRFILGKVLKEIEGMTSFATVKHLSAKELNKLELDMPKYEEQVHRSSVLLKVEDIIDKRRLQLDNLDELVRARFVEMFGDPIINSKRLDTNILKDVFILKAGDFTAASDIAVEQSETNSYPCYGGNGIRGYVAEYNQEGEYSIVGRQGALSGNVQFASGKFKNTEHALLVIPIVEMNNTWINHLLLNLDLKRYQTGAAQPGLSVKNLQEIQIISVPIDKQNQFADFVHQVNKSKLLAASQPQIHIYKTLTLL